VIATRSNKADDALKLFEAAVQKNPNNRDGLRNLAATYYGKDKFQEMFAPSRKLVDIDPNNYDGWMMFAYAAQGLGKAAKLPAEKKAWTDTLVKYNTIAEGLPVKVDVAGFSRGSQNAKLTLSLEQIAATGTYSVTAEFLDAAGNVVASATESTGALKKGERKEIVLKADGDKIYGYRYKPIK
jgi:tetratricopeptide (TPR) repeat protein